MESGGRWGAEVVSCQGPEIFCYLMLTLSKALWTQESYCLLSTCLHVREGNSCDFSTGSFTQHCWHQQWQCGGTRQQSQRALRSSSRLVAHLWDPIFTEMPVKIPNKLSLSLWKYMEDKQTESVENCETHNCENWA